MIGRSVRHIKNRSAPEMNIMKRVLLERTVLLDKVAAAGAGGLPLLDDADEDVDSDLTPSVTNSHTAADRVAWPNIRAPNECYKLTHGAPRLCDSTLTCCRDVLIGYLGSARVAEVTLANQDITGVTVLEMDAKKVTIGTWMYATVVHEAKNTKLRTSRAWFSIPGAAVPEYVAYCGEKGTPVATSLYGRFVRFYYIKAQLGASPPQFSVARVQLFQPQQVHPITKLATINIAQPLQCAKFIELRQVTGPIALGPLVLGIDRKAKSQEADVCKYLFVAMHITR
jgi:hypothetical protein